ncbi:MAG: T9SS type A sorting domain-containing protein [Lewinellaceae bacterium]|nr:T9SS type A sorting domain-containing protein [Lewinellaceae bacterium]
MINSPKERRVLSPIALMIIFLLIGLVPGKAQQWQWLSTLGGVSAETLDALAPAPNDGWWLGGSWLDRLPLPDTSLVSRGEADVFVIHRAADGQLTPILTLGGPDDEYLRALVPGPDGDFFIAGTFWREMNYPGGTLRSSTNPRAAFLMRCSPTGTVHWAQTLEGGSRKEVTDLLWMPDHQQLFLSGYFADSLLLTGTDQRWTARGSSDAFLMDFNPDDGSLIQAATWGEAGDSRPVTLQLSPTGQLVVAGQYNERLPLGDTTLIANTRDWDVFLATLDASTLEVQWARRAGGVFEETVADMVLDPLTGDIFCTGSLVGVMRLDSITSIQSQDGNADIFLISYTPGGQLRWGRALSGNSVQTASSLALTAEGDLFLSGFLLGDLQMDAFRLDAGTSLLGFLAEIDPGSGQATRLDALGLPGVCLPQVMQPAPNGAILLGGAFTGPGQLPPLQLPTTQGYDLFLAYFGAPVTALRDHLNSANAWQVFPNPATDYLHLRIQGQADWVRLWDAQGREVASWPYTPTLSLPPLPTGVYRLGVITGNRLIAVLPVVIAIR